MIEKSGNEVIVNVESENYQGMAAEHGLGNDVKMTEGEVPSNGGETLVNDVEDRAAACSDVEQSIKGEPTEMGLRLLDNPFDAGQGQNAKGIREEIPDDSNRESSGSRSMRALMRGEGVMSQKVEANGFGNVSPVAGGNVKPISAESDVDFEIAKTDSANKNFSHVEHETFDGKSKQNDERNSQIQTSVDVMMTSCPDSEDCKEKMKGISAPTPCRSKDADERHGSDVKSLVEVSEPASESLELIESSAGCLVQPQDCSDDTVMLDSGEVNEVLEDLVPVPDVPMFESEDNGAHIGSVSGIREEADVSATVGLHEERDESEEMVAGVANGQTGLNVGTDVGVESFAEAGKSEEKNVSIVPSGSGSLAGEYRATYELPCESSDGFSISDLVWGKVKSHPWWPGQIFHPSDASEKAMKYYRKDCYLVAYFGDASFAWNEASQLKPFRTHFFSEEKQSSSEAFKNAVDSALEEVSRRVELGLACSCVPEETYDSIKFQTVENAGIQKDSSRREGGDGYSSAESFRPDMLVDYVRSLGQSPTCCANQLELRIAKSQLLSLSRLKGFHLLPEFQFHEGLLENDADTLLHEVNNGVRSEGGHADSVATGNVPCTVKKGSLKRKHNLKDMVYNRRKESSFSKITEDSMFYYDEDYDSDEMLDSLSKSSSRGRRRKASFVDDESMVPESTRTISLAKVSHTATPSLRQSFKIGDCIRRVASQMTGSPSTSKRMGDSVKQHSGHEIDELVDTPEDGEHGKMGASVEQTSPDEFLWELQLTAQDPRRGHGFSSSLARFFFEFRDAVVLAERKKKNNSSSVKGSCRKRKPSLPAGGLPETFEFQGRKDSYWTDMVVQNNSEGKQPSRRGRKRKDRQLTTGDHEKPTQSTRRRHSTKQYTHDNNELAAEKPSADEGKRELPTELKLKFSDMSSFPSEAYLSKMFRRFGPLRESETGVDRQNSCARVVFKSGSDAQVAYSSAATFNIFGAGIVNYELNQITATSSHSSTLALNQCIEELA